MSEPLRIAVLLRRLRNPPDGELAMDVIGACERAALAAAVTLGEERDARVTAVAVGGGARENRVLAMALRAGCHAAVRLDDSACGELDFLGVARLIAAYCRRNSFDLILSGARSQDEQQGAVGPAVAEELGVPHSVGAVDVRLDETSATITPAPGGGGVGEQRLTLPGLVSVARFDRRAEAVDTRAPGGEDAHDDDRDDRGDAALNRDGDADESAPGATADRSTAPTLEEFEPDDLGVDPRELRQRHGLAGTTRPRRRTERAVLLDSPEDLVARLRADHLIEP